MAKGVKLCSFVTFNFPFYFGAFNCDVFKMYFSLFPPA